MHSQNACRVLIALIAALLCGCASSKNSSPPIGSPLSPKQLQARNNAASLLYDLLGDEKKVNMLLIIKSARPELKQLIKTIASMAGDGQHQLEALAKKDKTLDLEAMSLPAGEQATREEIAKTERSDLLKASGADLEFKLLLTQANAMRYGAHVAKVAAENSSQAEQVQTFNELSASMDNLYKQVTALMRSAEG